MRDTLLIGAGPLPEADSTQTCSYNLRTAKFADWLRGEGVPLRLAAVDIFNASDGRGESRRSSLVGEYELLPIGERGAARLSALIAEAKPGAILAVSYEAAAMVCELDQPLPVWADMPGWLPAEAQLKAAVAQDDSFVGQFTCRERAVLQRADRVSVISQNQRHATIGELAMLERLGRRGLNYPFVQVLPSIAHDWRPMLNESDSADRRARAQVVPDDALVLLWAGSYNLWTDADLIFTLVDGLMREMPGLHYVSTGGRLAGHNDEIIDRFLKRVEASPHRARYHMLPYHFGEVQYWFKRAALGLSIDGRNLEIEYGSRTRVVDMLAHGLPVAATTGTELLNDLRRAGAVVALDPGEPEAWSRSVLAALRSPERLRELAARGTEYVQKHYSLKATGAELLNWLRNPQRAPDAAIRDKEREAARGGVKGEPPTDNPFLNEDALVVWEPQARSEGIARRIVDAYPPGRRSIALQAIVQKLMASRWAKLPALTAWWIVSRGLGRNVAARWQSRIEAWSRDGEATGLDKALLRRSARAVYGRAMGERSSLREAKACNILLARHEYDLEWGLRCRPQRIEIEASSACNIRCRMCKIPYVKKPGIFMSRETFDRVVPWLRHVATLEIIGEGEPTLNPALPHMIERAAENECFTRIITNGTKLSMDLADVLVTTRVGIVVVSVYGGDAETYLRITKSDLLESVVENCRDLGDLKRIRGSAYPKMHMNCPLIAQSLDSAPEVVGLAASSGFESVNFSIAYILKSEMEDESVLNVERARVERVFARCAELGRARGIPVILPPLPDGDAAGGSPKMPENNFGCLFPWQSLTIRADGTAEVCAYNRKIIGDVNRQSLDEIWNNDEFRRFRRDEVTDKGVNYCDMCYHRAYCRKKFNRDILFPYELCLYGYWGDHAPQDAAEAAAG